MKNLVIGVVGLAAAGISGAASAADLAARTYPKAPPAPYVSPVYDWTGFYIGINGGWGNANNFWTLQTPAGNFPEGGTNGNGGTVGGQIGYRWQTGPAVFGLEAQGNWANLTAQHTSIAAANAGFDNYSNLDAFGLFTGQIGYAWNTVLLYAKGGAAVTDSKYNDVITGTGARRRHQQRYTLGRRRGRGSGICLRPELVGGDRIRSSVHGQQHQQPHRNRRRRPVCHGFDQSERRPGHRARELQIRWPRRREILILAFSNKARLAGADPADPNVASG
jgi:outer membrane immunogenic protein